MQLAVQVAPWLLGLQSLILHFGSAKCAAFLVWVAVLSVFGLHWQALQPAEQFVQLVVFRLHPAAWLALVGFAVRECATRQCDTLSDPGGHHCKCMA